MGRRHGGGWLVGFRNRCDCPAGGEDVDGWRLMDWARQGPFAMRTMTLARHAPGWVGFRERDGRHFQRVGELVARCERNG